MVRAEPTRSALPGDQPLRRPRALVVGLSIVVLTVAVLQTAVVPILGIIADQLDASTVAVSWAVTANLLAAAAASRLAVTAQSTATVDASSWSAMMPRIGTTAVCRTATVRTTMLRPTTSALGRRSG